MRRGQFVRGVSSLMSSVMNMALRHSRHRCREKSNASAQYCRRQGTLLRVYYFSLYISLSFRNDVECRYFQTLRDDTVPQLTGSFTSSLWTKIILQACEHIREGDCSSYSRPQQVRGGGTEISGRNGKSRRVTQAL